MPSQDPPTSPTRRASMDEQNGSYQRSRKKTRSENGHTGSILQVRERSPTRSYSPTHTRPRSNSTDSIVTVLCVADRGTKWELNEDKTVIWLQQNGHRAAESDEHNSDTKMTAPDSDEARNHTVLASEQPQNGRLRVKLRTRAIGCHYLNQDGDGADGDAVSPTPTTMRAKGRFKMRVPRGYAQEYDRITDRQDGDGQASPGRGDTE